MSPLETDVPVQNVTPTPEEAKAPENDVRAKVLDMLADQGLTFDEIQVRVTCNHCRKVT